ncbi:MAG: YopX family protein [Nitrospiraceae bacterium]|nr:YopX family protein [Nitrospiraceae bacterium]
MNSASTKELKLRVWDNREMHYFPCITEWDIKDFSEFSRMIHKGCRVMQFTGLKDKDGEEIYEGDIIQRFDTDKGLAVIWHEDIAAYGFTEITSYIFDQHFASRHYKYAGNIYQNPELLSA